MGQMRDGLHEFALWQQSLDSVPYDSGASVRLTDTTLCMRIAKVLRRNMGDTLVLFDGRCAMRLLLHEVTPYAVRADIVERWRTDPPSPSIKLYLPFIEKSAFEQVLTVATVFGVAHVYPIITDKTDRHTRGIDTDRAMRLMIAAAEQSKQFVIPMLHSKRSLQDVDFSDMTALLAVDGATPHALLQASISVPSLSCIVGPEGDFTSQERSWLQTRNVLPVSLGAAVLRSELAVTVLLGMVRAYGDSRGH